MVHMTSLEFGFSIIIMFLSEDTELLYIFIRSGLFGMEVARVLGGGLVPGIISVSWV